MSFLNERQVHNLIKLDVLSSAVYDPKRADNEDESIEMFKRFAADVALEESVRTRVIDMIAATKHHDLGTLEEEKDKKEDLCFFLDFDLQILGDKSETYDRYAADIRKEYIFYDDASYKQGRLLVLHGFLGKSHIFHTQVFRDLYENAARRNIKREIASIASADTSRSLEAIPTDLSDV